MFRIISILIFMIGAGVTYSCFLFLIPPSEQTNINLISLYGTYLSVFGLVLAYIQILSLKDVALKTQEAVKLSSNNIRKVLSVAELSKSKKLVEEIQHYLHNSNLSGAVIRMNDLKENLIQNKYVSQLSKQTSTKQYKNVIFNTGVDINSLNDKVSDPNVNIDISIIMRNLENAKSAILEFENQLKN